MATLGQYNPSDYTCEEIAILAATHLHEQGCKSEKMKYIPFDGTVKVCVYKGDNGITCGAGPFVIQYTPEMDEKNKTYSASVKNYSIDTDKLSLISEIQQIHDYPDDITEWKVNFYSLFKKHNFDSAALDSLYKTTH